MVEGYEFIIVGGGTAGLVLANRLTEDLKKEVLVIEAGTDRLDDPKVTIPGLATTTLDDPLYDWTFTTTPQENLYGKKVRHGRGKVLGGSSAINLMALLYPSRASIDAWETLGNKCWNWNGLAPYYQKSTRSTSPTRRRPKSCPPIIST
ncbi:glucose-methanol-choline oxidoreductase [Lipomyces starkeyi]